MIRYLVFRLATAAAALFGVSLFAFALALIAPGDPAEVILRRGGGEPSPTAIAELRTDLGLDRPAIVRYVDWLTHVVRGDLGRSYRDGSPVLGELLLRLPNTAILASSALLFAMLVGLPLGILAAAAGAGSDFIGRVVALAGVAVPSYWLATILILVFAVQLRWLPTGGAGSMGQLVLPAIALGLRPAGQMCRLIRAGMVETLGADFIVAARARGVGHRAIVLRHALPHALPPTVALLGVTFGRLLGGSAIVETIVAWPGLGRFAVEAVYDRDYPVLQGLVLVGGLVYTVIGIAVDFVHRRLDPRVRFG